MSERGMRIAAGACGLLGLMALWYLVDGPWVVGWSMRTIHLVAIGVAATVALAASLVVLWVAVRCRRALERANEDLQRHERMKDELTRIVVHDLKNPLMAVTGFAELLLAREPLAREVREAIQHIDEAGRTMLQMTLALLDIARIGDLHMTLQQEEVPVGELFGEAVREMHPLLSLRHCRIVTESVPEDLSTVADRTLAVRVLTNLLSNALNHARGCTEVCLKAAIAPGESSVLISVSDDGEGIPPTLQEGLFDRFKQVQLRTEG